MNTEYLFWKDLIGVHCVSGSGSYTHLFIQHTLFTSEVFGIKVMKGCLLSKLEKIPVVLVITRFFKEPSKTKNRIRIYRIREDKYLT